MTISVGKGLESAVFLDFYGHFYGMSVEQKKIEDYAEWLLSEPRQSQADIYMKSHPKVAQETAKKCASRYFKSAKELFAALPTKKKLEYLGAGEIDVIRKAAKLMDAKKVVFCGDDRAEIPDNPTQIRAVELCANMNGLTGRNTTEQADQSQDNELTLTITDEAAE